MKVKCICQNPNCPNGVNGQPKVFYVIPFSIKSGRGKYCCRKCKYPAKIKCVCQNPSCSNGINGQPKEFDIHPCEAKNRKKHFCCRKCYKEKVKCICQNPNCSNGIDGKPKIFYIILAKIKMGNGKYCCHKCFLECNKGENNHLWKGGITPLHEQIRKSDRYKKWRLSVFKKDSFVCQDCGQAHKNLNAHHLKEFTLILQENNITTIEQALQCQELWNVENGITLCGDCHIERHKKQSFEEGRIRGHMEGFIMGRIYQKQLALFKTDKK